MKAIFFILALLPGLSCLAVTNFLNNGLLVNGTLSGSNPATDSPANYTQNMKLWLKADAGITVNAAGLLSAWTDQSGNGNDAGQLVEADRPLVLTNAYGNGNTVRFDGVSEFLTVARISMFSQVPGWTLIVACRQRVVPAVNVSILSYSLHQEQFDVAVTTTNGFRVFNTSLSAQGVDVGGSLDNGLRVLSFVGTNASSGAGMIFRNNSELGTVSATGSAYDISFNRIGAYDVFASFAAVDISELIVWTNRVLTHFELNSLTTKYFNRKYIITKP